MPDTPDQPAQGSVYSYTFPELLDRLAITVAVTTYQAGRLVLLRAEKGGLNTHFRAFPRPMGLAYRAGRLAVGAMTEVWDFRNVPEAAARLEPAGRHDGCFLPRSVHVTGDIFVHELAWAGPELWVVNTRYSSLWTLDQADRFVPRWRPPFVTALVAEDRCHLNGLALVDGRPAYVTALGQTDAARGWRENKRNGGVLLTVPEGEVVAAGLCMPHSPRMYGGNLLLLESGTGTLGVVDRSSGRYRAIAVLPGFTRGLDIYDRYAFIGLSQVRETAEFGGLPITDRAERISGVWVLDLTTGRTVAFLRFEAAVQEVFAVQVLPRLRYPELINDDTIQAKSGNVCAQHPARSSQESAGAFYEMHVAACERR
ncbi:MAG: TIGR03032 family protein [Thermoguttaceae bacterium]